MKKRICIMLAAIMTALLLSACGEETYRCGWCQKEVTQKPHTITALGQEIKVCDDCYDLLSQYAINVD